MNTIEILVLIMISLVGGWFRVVMTHLDSPMDMTAESLSACSVISFPKICLCFSLKNT